MVMRERPKGTIALGRESGALVVRIDDGDGIEVFATMPPELVAAFFARPPADGERWRVFDLTFVTARVAARRAGKWRA